LYFGIPGAHHLILPQNIISLLADIKKGNIKYILGVFMVLGFGDILSLRGEWKIVPSSLPHISNYLTPTI
jgi:hypothetical protein